MSNNLTFFEREKLQWLFKSKQSLRNIAKVMQRDVSVISREVQRNSSGRKKYRADVAQRLWEKRRHTKHAGKLEKHPELRIYVEEYLKEDWSPEQIAGELKKYPPKELVGLSISHESIYYWVYEKSEKYRMLHKHLRTHRKKRYKHGKRKSKKVNIPSRISISERPKTIDDRFRYGDWESDTVEFSKGKKNPYLSVQYERKSQLVRIHKMKDKTAQSTKEALIKTAESVPRELFKSITFDNGTEGTKHAEIKKMYDVETYFCDPYCSWQKGGVENMNKLIRQYFPRKSNMHEVTDQYVYAIQEKLNNRPRKGLKYLTPNQIIHKVLH
jgi:IS30 family transposase